ncbi:MAG: mevalonate kinase, partial [Saprospiraceae bacterium]|nr:mevalonate kinase [Saprospiraceae bacterium]
YRFLSGDETLNRLYDLKSFKSDLDHSLCFNSDIPYGYGLGSSGALVAAFYDRYCLEKTQDLVELKSILSATENAFHGASSGIDPLVSYTGTGILVEEDGKLSRIDTDIIGRGLFLVDTGISRRTEPLVDAFRDKFMSNSIFSDAVAELSTYNKDAIHAFIKKDQAKLNEAVRLISGVQSEHFSALIPEAFMEIWTEGLVSGKFNLKLCGAGGGGFLMGLLHDPEYYPPCLDQYDIIKI